MTSLRAVAPESPTLAELAAHVTAMSNLRRVAFDRAGEGLWIIAADGTAVLNRIARQIAGDYEGEVDFGDVNWSVWRPGGSEYPPAEWPAARALAGEIVRDEVLVILGPLRGVYAIHVHEAWPVRESGVVIGCTVRISEIPVPGPGPWDRG